MRDHRRIKAVVCFLPGHIGILGVRRLGRWEMNLGRLGRQVVYDGKGLGIQSLWLKSVGLLEYGFALRGSVSLYLRASWK